MGVSACGHETNAGGYEIMDGHEITHMGGKGNGDVDVDPCGETVGMHRWQAKAGAVLVALRTVRYAWRARGIGAAS